MWIGDPLKYIALVRFEYELGTFELPLELMIAVMIGVCGFSAYHTIPKEVKRNHELYRN